jgi:Mg2+/Co2+ transporter CorB
MDLELVLTLVAIAVLLVLSAFFSGSETALTAASRAQMHSLEMDGNSRARLVGELTRRRDNLIGALLIGNNLVNILASALATSLMITLVGSGGVAYATAIMTTLVLIFSEVMPKTYAIHNPNRVALAVAPLAHPLVAALAPVIHVIQLIVSLTLRLFGVRIAGAGRLVSPADELRGAVDLHTREGRMVKSDKDMLGGILDLPDVQVADIMVHRGSIVMIDGGQSSKAIVDEVFDCAHTRVPLWRDNPENIVGVLHAKDLLRAIHKHGGDYDAIDVVGLARAPWFVPETTTLIEQLNAFRERREHFALVVDEYGALMGLVTLEDILEEIVGEIADEHDVSRAESLRPQPDGSLIVDGTTTLRDLNRYGDWNLPEDKAATIAGLLINQARRIPEVGERFSYFGFRFEVLRRHRNRITTLRMIAPPEA